MHTPPVMPFIAQFRFLDRNSNYFLIFSVLFFPLFDFDFLLATIINEKRPRKQIIQKTVFEKLIRKFIILLSDWKDQNQPDSVSRCTNSFDTSFFKIGDLTTTASKLFLKVPRITRRILRKLQVSMLLSFLIKKIKKIRRGLMKMGWSWLIRPIHFTGLLLKLIGKAIDKEKMERF